MPTLSRCALTGLALTTLMSALDTSIANAALPALARAFDASFQSVRWAVLAYLLALTSFAIVAGRLGDVFGRRRLLLAGIATFTAASLACGIAPSLGVLLVARAVQGLGAASMMTLAIASIADVVPGARTGRAMGLLGTMSAIGTTLGPSVGGALTARLGWEAIFLVNVPIGIIALLLVSRSVASDARDIRVKSTRLQTLAGVALLSNPAVAASVIASAAVATVMMTTLVVGPFYLSRTLGLSVAAAGFALSAGPLVAMLAGVPAGRLVDRLGAPATTLAGLTGLAAGAAVVGILPEAAGLPGYVAPIVVMTASYALFQAANNTWLMTTVSRRDRGAASGMAGLARNLGLVTGASLMGAVFAWAVGSGDPATASAEAVAAGVRATFRVATILISIAMAITVYSRGLTTRRMTSDVVQGEQTPVPAASSATS